MYSGQFGFLHVEPKSETGNYNRESAVLQSRVSGLGSTLPTGRRAAG